MITTIVLVEVDPKYIPACATALAGIPGVAEVYSVSGQWDLVVILRVPDLDRIALHHLRAERGPDHLHAGFHQPQVAHPTSQLSHNRAKCVKLSETRRTSSPSDAVPAM